MEVWQDGNEDWPSESENEEEDLAELESLLYSQIHYSQEDEAMNPEDGGFAVKNYIEDPVKKDGVKCDDSNISDNDSGCAIESRNVSPQIESVEDINVADAIDLHEEEESRYSSVKSKDKIGDPIGSDTDTSEASDDGIVVLPKPLKLEPEVIDLDNVTSPLSLTGEESDSSSTDSDIDIIEDSRSTKLQINPFFQPGSSHKKEVIGESVIVISESSPYDRKANKNDRKEISNSWPSSKVQKFREATDSETDSDESSDSDSSVELLEDGDNPVNDNLTVNVLGTSCNNRKRKMTDMGNIIGDSLANVLLKKTEGCRSWNEAMDKFYNEVDLENVDVELEDILRSMPKTAKWTVDRVDVYGGGPTRRRYFQGGARCNNCNQLGHLARQCPDPPKPVRCRMCGNRGHMETRCPEKCCLGCGQPGVMFLESCFHCRNLTRVECQECGGGGHLRNGCPDLWRRYHATTEPGDVVKPLVDSHRRKGQMWCCNCAGKGHLIDECRRYLYSNYPPPELRVQSYSEPPFVDLREGIGASGAQHGAADDRQSYVASAAALQFIKSDPNSGGGGVDRKKVKKRRKKRNEKSREEKAEAAQVWTQQKRARVGQD